MQEAFDVVLNRWNDLTSPTEFEPVGPLADRISTCLDQIPGPRRSFLCATERGGKVVLFVPVTRPSQQTLRTVTGALGRRLWRCFGALRRNVGDRKLRRDSCGLPLEFLSCPRMTAVLPMLRRG